MSPEYKTEHRAGTKAPTRFGHLSNYQLRQYINGCHSRGEYDDDFDVACREMNDRSPNKYQLGDTGIRRTY